MTIFCYCMITLPGSGGLPATCRSYQVLRFYFWYQNWILNPKKHRKKICLTIFCCCMVTLPGSRGPPATWRSYQVLIFYFRYQKWIPNAKKNEKTYFWSFFIVVWSFYLDLECLQQPWGATRCPDFIFDIKIEFLPLKNVYKHMLDHCLLLCDHLNCIWRALSYLLEQLGV